MRWGTGDPLFQNQAVAQKGQPDCNHQTLVKEEEKKEEPGGEKGHAPGGFRGSCPHVRQRKAARIVSPDIMFAQLIQTAETVSVGVRAQRATVGERPAPRPHHPTEKEMESQHRSQVRCQVDGVPEKQESDPERWIA